MRQIKIYGPGFYRQANGDKAEIVGYSKTGWWVGVTACGDPGLWSMSGWCSLRGRDVHIVDAWADDAEDAPNPAEQEQDAPRTNVGDDMPLCVIRHGDAPAPPHAPDGDWRMLLRGETIHAGDLWAGVWTRDRSWHEAERLIGRMQHEETSSWVIRRVTWTRTGNLMQCRLSGAHNGLCIHGYTLCYEEVSDHPQPQTRWVPVPVEA